MVIGIVVDGARVDEATDDEDAVESPAVGSVDGFRDGSDEGGDDDEETIDSILVDIAVGSEVGMIEGSSVLEGPPSFKSDNSEVDDNEGWVDVYSEIVETDEGSTLGRTERSFVKALKSFGFNDVDDEDDDEDGDDEKEEEEDNGAVDGTSFD